MLHNCGVIFLVPEKARACLEKTCACMQIISTAEMRRRLVGDNRVFVCAVDPGLVITNVVRTTPGWIQYLYRVLLTTLLVTPKEGGSTSPDSESRHHYYAACVHVLCTDQQLMLADVLGCCLFSN